MNRRRPSRRSTPRSDRAAFTLVEAIIAMTIFVLAIGAVMSTFIGTLRSTHALSDAIDWNARSRFVQERLLFDLRAVTKVTTIDSQMAASEVAKVFENYSGSEVSHCFRSFTAEVNEYSGTGTVEITYTLVDDGTTPAGKPKKALLRQKNGETARKVLTNLQDGCFTFYTRKKDTGTLTSLASSKTADVNAIRFAFLPQGRAPLVPGTNDPSCSAVVQLRYPSYKK
ncbi:MAG TPA: prepilin-type N-terminal cleavage/methylation domain-containing protein [Opitutaceae bacterium]|nr:prepilin-type N-terminal cleavage/methylation domain-containing protein [Opitutaceae bacterium]